MIMQRIVCACLLLLAACRAAPSPVDAGFRSLFNGKTVEG